MKKLLTGILAAGALAACSQGGGQGAEASGAAPSGGTNPAAVSGDNVIKLGYAGPLSGPQAHYGEDYKSGIQMAIDEANTQNITVNGKPAKFVLDAQDDQADPKTATQVAQHFIDNKIAGLIGHFNSGCELPASRLYSNNNLPHLTMATNPKVTEQGFKNVFRSITSDKQQGLIAGKYVVEKMGLKKVMVIDDGTAYGQGLADEFAKAIQDAGGTVLPRQHTDDKSTDFQSILTIVKSQAPDLIYYGGADTQSGPMMKQIKRLGITAKFMSGEMTKTPDFLKVAGADAEGAYATLSGLPLEKMPKGQEYAGKYKSKFNKEVATYSPYSYDSTWALINAMKEANSSDPAKYLPKLAATNMPGVTGTIQYDERGDIKDATMTVYQVKDGKWIALDSVGGGAK